MEYRELGKTGLKVPVLSFGASSLGDVFHSIKENEALKAVFTAVENGLNPHCSSIVTQSQISIKTGWYMVKSGLVAPRTQLYLVEKQNLHFFKSLCSAHQGLAGFNNSHELCRMFFKTQTRVNPQTGELSTYYRLVESYRNVLGEVRQRSILPAGFMDDITPEELWAVADGLNARYSGDQNLFAHTEKVQRYIDLYWDRLVSEKKLDIVREVRGKEAKKDWQKIDMGSIKNKDVREAGAEWLSIHAASQLRLKEFFKSAGFTEEEGNLALSHIVSRAVYPASELKTVSFMQENSSICELFRAAFK